MRLHSDFRAYYDNALGYGIDDKVYCERVTKKVKLNIHTKLNWPLELFRGVVGFCGGFDLKESFRKKKQINK
jgi:hypothetical protein